MIDIKLRAWDEETNTMVYFDLLDIQNNIFSVRTLASRNDWGNPVMQYTGLKDKNGKEIYEGDTMQFSNKRERYRGGLVDRQEVESDHTKYPYERREVDIPKSYERLLSGEIQSYREVIGNKRENPELLSE